METSCIHCWVGSTSITKGFLWKVLDCSEESRSTQTVYCTVLYCAACLYHLQVGQVHVSAWRIIAQRLLPHSHVYIVNACAFVCLQHIYSPSAALYYMLIFKNQPLYLYDITERVHHKFIWDRLSPREMGLTKYLDSDLDSYGIITKTTAPFVLTESCQGCRACFFN